MPDSQFAIALTAGVQLDKGSLARTQKELKEGLGKVEPTAATGGREARRLGDVLDHIKRRATETWHVGGLGRTADDLRDIGRTAGSARDGLEKIGRLFGPAGGILSAASIGGLGLTLESFARGGAEIGRTAATIGNIDTAGLQRWRGAAKLAGLSADDATASLSRFAQIQHAAKFGLPEGSQALGAAAELGLSGSLQSDPDKFLKELADKIKGQAPQVQAAMARVFGVEELLPLLRKGGRAIDEYLDKSRKQSELNKNAIHDAEALEESFVGATNATGGFADALAGKLTPAFKPLLDGYTGLLTDLKESPAAMTAATIAAEVLAGALGLTLVGGLAKLTKGLVALNLAWSLSPPGLISLMLGGLGYFGMKGMQKAEEQGNIVSPGGVLPPSMQNAPIGPKPPGHGMGALGTWLEGTDFGRWLWGGSDSRKETPAVPAPHSSAAPSPTSASRFPGWLHALSPIGSANAAPMARIGRGMSANRELPAEARGLLDTIAGTEAPGYDVLYGGQKFSDFSKHPNIAVPITRGPNAGRNSTAAGRYQFLKSTWDRLSGQLGLQDFSPASQDLAAWQLATETYRQKAGRDLLADLKSGNTAQIGPALHGQWTSLPGGIEQGTSNQSFSSRLGRSIGAEAAVTPAAAGATPTAYEPAMATPAGATPAGYEPAMAGDTSHTVEVRFVDAPQGMRSGLTAGNGPAKLQLRTQYAMQGA